MDAISEFAQVLVGWFAYLLANSSWGMVGKLGSLLAMITMLIAFYRAHRSPNSAVNFEDMFTENGHIGGSKMRLNVAFLLCSWVIIYSTLNGTLSEWLFAAFIGAFVYDRAQSRKADAPAAPTSGT